MYYTLSPSYSFYLIGDDRKSTLNENTRGVGGGPNGRGRLYGSEKVYKCIG